MQLERDPRPATEPDADAIWPWGGIQAAWNRGNAPAGDRGGARAGSLRWVRIPTMTAGSSMAAMIFRRPAHRRMQAEAVRIGAPGWRGGFATSRDRLPAQQLLPGAWPKGNTVGAGTRLQGRERLIGRATRGARQSGLLPPRSRYHHLDRQYRGIRQPAHVSDFLTPVACSTSAGSCCVTPSCFIKPVAG